MNAKKGDHRAIMANVFARCRFAKTLGDSASISVPDGSPSISRGYLKWTPLFGPPGAGIKADFWGLPNSVSGFVFCTLRLINFSKRENEPKRTRVASPHTTLVSSHLFPRSVTSYQPFSKFARSGRAIFLRVPPTGAFVKRYCGTWTCDPTFVSPRGRSRRPNSIRLGVVVAVLGVDERRRRMQFCDTAD